tara:strand:- start:8514 stop:9089 length:576 start_codon:yes stop_codon:yes gene_type:complete
VSDRSSKIKHLNKISKDGNPDVPNPFRSNYDYGEGGYNFLDKIKELNKRRKKKKNKKKKKKSRSSKIETLLKESAREPAEYPHEFRVWLLRQMRSGRFEGYRESLKGARNQMARVGAWINGTYSPPRNSERLNFMALKKEWEAAKMPGESEEGDGKVDIQPGELRDLARAIEDSGGQVYSPEPQQLDLFNS